MDRTDITEGQAVWQPGGAEEDSCFCAGDSHLNLAYNDKGEEDNGNLPQRSWRQPGTCYDHSCHTGCCWRRTQYQRLQQSASSCWPAMSQACLVYPAA